MKRTLLLLCALLPLCGGCAAVQTAATPLSFPAQTAAASPTPAPKAPSQADVAADCLVLWKEALSIDVAPFLPENFFDAAAPWSIFDAPKEERAWLPAMEAAVTKQLSAAATRAVQTAADAHGALAVTAERTLTGPSWQLIYALVQDCPSAQAANARIKEAIALNVQTAGLPESPVLRLTAAPLTYRKALRLDGCDESVYWSRCFSYSYLYTVCGGDAMEIEYALPPAQGCLSDGFLWPLQSHTRLRKTWYADRDGGKRKHTGTDIWAKADTEIYACTDGTVSYVGEGKGTGFAVIVTDAYGYEYHYYHMIRLSDFLRAGDAVKAGALIGHVGNTGNSDLDHLHLTIVAPDGKYINPYPYLKAVEP